MTSAVPQVTMPIPTMLQSTMAKISFAFIWGSACFPPTLILPKGENITAKHAASTRSVVRLYSQPKFDKSAVLIRSSTEEKEPPAARDRMSPAARRMTGTQNTTLRMFVFFMISFFLT